jgi:hypothetical protein
VVPCLPLWRLLGRSYYVVTFSRDLPFHALSLGRVSSPDKVPTFSWDLLLDWTIPETIGSPNKVVQLRLFLLQLSQHILKKITCIALINNYNICIITYILKSLYVYIYIYIMINYIKFN